MKMNHIKFYDETITNMTVNFDVRFYFKEFHRFTTEHQKEFMSTDNAYMIQKDLDLTLLSQQDRAI